MYSSLATSKFESKTSKFCDPQIIVPSLVGILCPLIVFIKSITIDIAEIVNIGRCHHYKQIGMAGFVSIESRRPQLWFITFRGQLLYAKCREVYGPA